jgi:hypothetical protein
MNVLNLISQQLDTICQIKLKRATVYFLLFLGKLNTAKIRFPFWGDCAPTVWQIYTSPRSRRPEEEKGNSRKYVDGTGTRSSTVLRLILRLGSSPDS